MRRLLLAIAGMTLLAGLNAGYAYEDEDNNVHCGGTRLIPGEEYRVSYDLLEGDGDGRTVEGCADGDAEVQGRIYWTDEGDGAVAADGENDTPAGLQNWVRVNGDGSVTCYDRRFSGGNSDSTRNEGNFRNLDCVFLFIS